MARADFLAFLVQWKEEPRTVLSSYFCMPLAQPLGQDSPPTAQFFGARERLLPSLGHSLLDESQENTFNESQVWTLQC